MMGRRLAKSLLLFPLFFAAQMPEGFEDIKQEEHNMKYKERWKPGGRNRVHAGAPFIGTKKERRRKEAALRSRKGGKEA